MLACSCHHVVSSLPHFAHHLVVSKLNPFLLTETERGMLKDQEKVKEMATTSESEPNLSDLGAADSHTETPTASTDSQSKQAQSSPADDSTSSGSWRQLVGQGMHAVSDAINENIVAARYATIASIVLLSAYGVASTPLFFRFKTVKDIPCMFVLGVYYSVCSLASI